MVFFEFTQKCILTFLATFQRNFIWHVSAQDRWSPSITNTRKICSKFLICFLCRCCFAVSLFFFIFAVCTFFFLSFCPFGSETFLKEEYFQSGRKLWSLLPPLSIWLPGRRTGITGYESCQAEKRVKTYQVKLLRAARKGGGGEKAVGMSIEVRFQIDNVLINEKHIHM